MIKITHKEAGEYSLLGAATLKEFDHHRDIIEGSQDKESIYCILRYDSKDRPIKGHTLTYAELDGILKAHDYVDAFFGETKINFIEPSCITDKV